MTRSVASTTAKGSPAGAASVISSRGRAQLDSSTHCKSDNSSARARGSKPPAVAAASQSGTSLAQQFLELFPSLGKTQPNQSREQLGIVMRQFSRRPRRELYEGGIDLRLWEKNARRNRAQIFDAMMKLNEKRERAVVGRARLGRETARHFFLQHAQPQ